MCYDEMRKVSKYIEYNQEIYCFKNYFLHSGTSHPCPRNHSEHKNFGNTTFALYAFFVLIEILLLFGIALTGVGAAMSLNMRIIPNPGDGIVQAIADCIHKPVGFTKNCFDLCNICITITISLLFAGHLVGVGLGTVLSVLGVGRCIAVFNHFFKNKMNLAAGVEE